MARNFKKDYLKKLLGIETKNGYKVDLANYLKNPSYLYTYPTLAKVTEKTDTTTTTTIVYYFKYYDGSGEYATIKHITDNNGEIWRRVKEADEKILEKSNRFDLDKLIRYAESL